MFSFTYAQTSAMVTRMRTTGFQTNTEEEKRRGKRGGRTTKSCSCSSDTDTTALGTGPERGPDTTESFYNTLKTTGRLQLPSLTAILRGPLGLRSERQLLFRRHFSNKMADTPLPQRCASCTEFLPFSTNLTALCAVGPVQLTAETFRRVSILSDRLSRAPVLTLTG